LIAEATAIRSHPARAAWPDCAVETHKMGLWRIVAGMGLCIGDAGQWHQLIAAAASAGAVNSAPGSYIMFSPLNDGELPWHMVTIAKKHWPMR
jgi:hypothetical protein